MSVSLKPGDKNADGAMIANAITIYECGDCESVHIELEYPNGASSVFHIHIGEIDGFCLELMRIANRIRDRMGLPEPMKQ